MRYFLGVGKYTPNTALAGEMAWIPPIVRQWKTIALSWSRLSCSFQSRVNTRIALWANHKSGNTCNFHIISFVHAMYICFVCNDELYIYA